MQITICMNASRFLNLAAIFSLDLESQFKYCHIIYQLRKQMAKLGPFSAVQEWWLNWSPAKYNQLVAGTARCKARDCTAGQSYPGLPGNYIPWTLDLIMCGAPRAMGSSEGAQKQGRSFSRIPRYATGKYISSLGLGGKDMSTLDQEGRILA